MELSSNVCIKKLEDIFSNLKNMETPYPGKNEWSEGNPITMYSIINDESVNDNLDLIVVPQYGRNLDHTG
ncbi:hypothetical protein WN943_006640 [Citrus x changshan-huyou]